MLNAPYDELQRQLAAFIPAARLVTDPLRLLAWGSDASFYRLVPQLVVVVESAKTRCAACSGLLRGAEHTGDVSRCRHQPVGPGAE
jgi:hypothetical protein